MMPAIDRLILTASSSMPASILVKATLLLVLGLSATAIARRARAAVRHALLCAAFGVLLLVPVASVVVPAVRIEVPVAAQQAPEANSPAMPGDMISNVSSSIPLHAPATNARPDWVLAAWIAGVALFLAPVAFGLWQVRRLRRSAVPWTRGQAAADLLARDAGIRRVELLLQEDLPGPVTCGVLHPAVILPSEAQEWDAEDLTRAIVHELEHVRRGDWVSQCIARTVCAAYWFHPLVWMAWRKLTLEAERSCDDAVLRRSEATAYADQLVTLAQRLSTARSPLLAMANRSDLATRVRALLDNRQQRGRAGALPVALACTAAAALVFTVSPFRMVAAAPVPAPPAPAPIPAPAIPAPLPVASQPAAAPAPVPARETETPAAAEAAPAPQTVTPNSLPPVRFVSRSSLVVVTVSVTDVTGKPIDGLGARDFVVTEDGVTQTISTFEFQRVQGGTTNGPGSYYVIGYYTKNGVADGQFRKIQVTDVNDTSAKVESRSGYFANKPVAESPEVQAAVPALQPGYKAPVLVFKKEAEYTEEARKAKYQGTVTLYVEVTDAGMPQNIKVLRSLGLGLDEKAIEAVKQWVFKPGTKPDGTPVTTATAVTVEFRLL